METIRMFKYRIYPSKKQQRKLFEHFDESCKAYNDLLTVHNITYEKDGFGLNRSEYNKYLKGKYPKLYSQALQNVADRLAKTFQAFFRRMKDPKIKRKGYPRFKSRVHSITYPQSGFKLQDKKIYCSKIGSIPVVLHRVPQGNIKTLTIKRNRAGQWFAAFSTEIEIVAPKHPHPEMQIGIDMGLTDLMTLDDGSTIEHKKFYQKSQHKLGKLQRIMFKRVKGSNNRRKARFRVARLHNKIANQRLDYQHKISKQLTQRYGYMAIEDLNIENMKKNHRFAKNISDAGWGTIANMLSYKAVTSGGKCERYNPNGSTSRCNICNTWNDMPINKRVFVCKKCGYAEQRDVKAAKWLLDKSRAGLARTDTPVDIASLPSIESMASAVDEAGTIIGAKNAV